MPLVFVSFGSVVEKAQESNEKADLRHSFTDGLVLFWFRVVVSSGLVHFVSCRRFHFVHLVSAPVSSSLSSFSSLSSLFVAFVAVHSAPFVLVSCRPLSSHFATFGFAFLVSSRIIRQFLFVHSTALVPRRCDVTREAESRNPNLNKPKPKPEQTMWRRA